MTDTRVGADLAREALAKGNASRRGVMCGLAGLGAAGALAACGTAESPSDSDAESSAGATDGATSEGADSGAGTGIATTEDVPEGGGLVVDETVIVQPTADEFLAFSAVCPHMGTIVEAPDADGNIVCPNHGSTWTIDGELEQGPAEVNLSAVEITVEDGQIFLA
ncbi:Rieske (2Fe-2S) protein [Glycomyces harbinensis]|uniref:Cytochrome bc1 complex Rieske iron-sulfur subunit n=1 Tax=Glycomyces harbinensis TaxID=58114 RepID=A0A1G6YPY0_9ACTN|nr:Rieske (2Fe-2S) protein [Glycomyces harbinensis]SDD92564.1 Ferredoxin subunit of nitrite reductase or a ring-hydroxylating dioxygenase [Glycomyces harbinensis]